MTKQTLFTQIDSNKHKSIGIMIGFFLIVEAFGTCMGVLFAPSKQKLAPTTIEACLITLVVTGVYMFYTMHKSINIIMAMNHGTEIKNRSEAPVLWDAVSNMAIAANLPMPKVFIIDDKSPNAFSTGNDPRHAAIGATAGLLHSMDKYEVEGVIGHEMSHIKDYDIRVETVGIALTSIFAFLGGLIWRLTWDADWFSDDDNNNNDDDGTAIILAFVVAIICWICSGLCYLTQLALSRNREYLADIGSVDLTRNPDEIIRALESLENRPSMKKANPSSNALYIADPYKPKHRWSLSRLFDTHPPLDKRIARLKRLTH